jgi:hypothetical protein
LKRRPDQLLNKETITEKILKAYAKSKLKSDKRRLKGMTGKNKWTPKVNEMVLVKKHPTSDAIQGITMKFQRPYEGPYVIQTVINLSLVELKDTLGKYKGLFSKKHLKPYHDFEKEEKVDSEEVSINVIEVTKAECRNRTTNTEDWKSWKVRPPPKRKKEIQDHRIV